MHTAGRELIDLIYAQNAKLRCFKHTFDEIWRILDASAHALQNQTQIRRAYGDAVEHFLASGYTSSDAQLEMEKLEERLQSLRIQVKAKPPHEPHTTVNESRLGTILEGEVGYRGREALLHDLDSLTAIHRLRRGNVPTTLESCKAIFLTSNSSLARASALFFQEEYGQERTAIPHCMRDHTFSTLIWLKTPLQAPDLPKRRIIADSYAALNPSDILWKAYLQEIDRLQRRGNISDQDYNLLRFSAEARNTLMELTLGDPEEFSEGTVEEVLERARTAARSQLAGELEGERAKRLEAEKRAAESEAREELVRRLQMDHFAYVGARAGVWSARLLHTIGVALLIVGVYATFPKPFPSLLGGWSKLLIPALLVLVGVLTVLHLVYGTTLKHLIRKLELAISARVERILGRVMLPNKSNRK